MGEYINNKRNGNGKEYYDNGKLAFEGKYFLDRKWEGKGYDILENQIFELKNGKGTVKDYYNNGKLFFEGEYINGQRNGKGKEFSKEGELIFEGNYLHDKRNGKGKEFYNLF